MKTYAPSFTISLAAATPMPLFPPVPSAILPSSFPTDFVVRVTNRSSVHRYETNAMTTEVGRRIYWTKVSEIAELRCAVNYARDKAAVTEPPADQYKIRSAE